MLYKVICTHVRYVMFRTEAAYAAPADWREMPIDPVDTSPLEIVPSALCRPAYFKQGLTEDPRVFLRSHVFTRTKLANKLLAGSGYQIVILDGWRPVSLQERLFWWCLKQFSVPQLGYADQFINASLPDEVREAFCRLSDTGQQKLREHNCQYCSWPSTDPAKPSPHATGGAVDVWLTHESTGDLADMGVPFDWMEENANAFYHLRNDRSRFRDDDEVCNRRTRLIWAMTSVGFACIPSEFWHFEFGTQKWALVTALPATYSYIEPK